MYFQKRGLSSSAVANQLAKVSSDEFSDLLLRAWTLNVDLKSQNDCLLQTPIQVFGIEGRYATALYSAASKGNKIDAVSEEVKSLGVKFFSIYLELR